MKKIIFIILITPLVFWDCNNEKTVSAKQAQREKDSLESIINQKESDINNYLASFTNIERTLDSINLMQKNIFLKINNSAELKGSVIDNINFDIKAINNLIQNNQKTIAQLNKTLRNTKSKNEALNKTIITLNDQLSKKQNELSALNSKLISLNSEIWELNVSIGSLNAKNEMQNETIEKQTAALHKAYYIIGLSKDLLKENIIDKKGGFIGLGKTKELNDDFDASKFTQIDYTQTVSIPVNCKRIEIITSHPTNSFKLERENGQVKNLIITNPNQFWGTSKCLVIAKTT